MSAVQICGKEMLIEGKLIRIARVDAEGYDFLEDPERALKELSRCNRRVDVFTFVQKVADSLPKYSYLMEKDNTATLPVSTFDHWMKYQIDFKARNKFRKAAKAGVVVREVPFDEDLLRGISIIYNETPLRQGKRFWHYGKDIESLRRMKSTFLDRSIFIGAFLDDRLIGFVKLVTNEDKSQAGLMHILSMVCHRDKAPTNALIGQAVQSCADRGIPHLWYASFSYGRKQQDSLADFKRHNGFKKVDLLRYFVPLTVTGQIGLRMGLHHKIADQIPENLAAKYRKIRGLWYARKFPGVENA